MKELKRALFSEAWFDPAVELVHIKVTMRYEHDDGRPAGKRSLRFRLSEEELYFMGEGQLAPEVKITKDMVEEIETSGSMFDE